MLLRLELLQYMVCACVMIKQRATGKRSAMFEIFRNMCAIHYIKRATWIWAMAVLKSPGNFQIFYY